MNESTPEKPELEEMEPDFRVPLSAWIAGARPRTLAAGVAPVLAGVALAAAKGHAVSWWLAACTLLSCLCIQAATNYMNDAIDGKKGTDTDARLGPARLTAKGVTDWRQTLLMGISALVIASVFALPLIHARGWPILAIGLPSAALAYAYTGGPKPLAYNGMGEIFVLIFFGFVATLGSVFVQTGQWPGEAWIAGTQVGLASTLLIVVNNTRDIDEDRRAGKMTLAARFGLRFARWETAVLAAAIPLTGLLWLATGFPLASLAGAFSLVLTAPLVRAVFRTDPSVEYNAFLARSAKHLILFTAALAALWFA